MAATHVPVLFNESLQGLCIKANGTYVDCTFGRGGHSKAILEELTEQGRLIVLDQDPSAVQCAEEIFGHDARVIIHHETFANLQAIAKQNHLHANVDGIFFDLGVSSPQLDEAQRGFSFSHDGPLDMRMNTNMSTTAATWLAHTTMSELVTVLREYGEERYAKKIAHKILQIQQTQAITTTKQLAEIVQACYPPGYKGVHPATRTFQAMRIVVNQELDALKKGLDATFDMLNHGGRLVVISFHSLEDRIVKRFIREKNQKDLLPARLPVMPEFSNYLKPIGKLIRPTEQEIKCNPRARSARLRVAEKVVK